MPKWKYLILFLSLLAGTAQADPTLTQSIMSGELVPPRTSVEFLRYADRFQQKITEVTCPTSQGTVYYFDSDGGSDAANGLTTGTPKQTISEMNTLLAAGGSKTILLQRGDTWTGDVGINIPSNADNSSIGGWGTGKNPMLKAFSTAFASGGSLWSVDSGVRYVKTQATEIGWIRETNNPYKVLRRVTSTAEVLANGNSWYWSGGNLYLHLLNAAGTAVDPDTVALEVTLTTTTDDSGIAIASGATGIRVDGIDADGWGCDGGETNQEYGIRSIATGSDVHCITNCSAYYNARHSLGHNGGSGVSSGGLTVWVNCKCGLDIEDTAAPFVLYIGSGLQEGWVFDCSTDYGALPITAARTGADGLAALAHTDGSVAPGFIAFINHRIPAPANGFGCTGAIALDHFAVETSPDTCDAVIIGTILERNALGGTGSSTTGAGQAFCMDGVFESGGNYHFVPGNSSVDAFTSDTARGFLYNTNIYLDLEGPGFTETLYAIWNSSSTRSPKLRGCWIHVKSRKGCHFGLDYVCNFPSATSLQAAELTGAELTNSIFTTERVAGDGLYIRPAFPNSSSCLKHNAYYDITADSTYIGTSNTVNGITLAMVPPWRSVPGRSSQLAATGRGGYGPYDQTLFGRPVVNPSIGPLQMRTSALFDPSLADIADAIWDQQTTDNDLAGSVGLQENTLYTNVGTAGAGLSAIPDQTINLTGTWTGSVTGSVGSVTGAVGSVTGNVGGNVTGSVGSVASGGITATSIATDAIGAAELAADAVTEIQSGLATASALTTVDDFLDTEIAALTTNLATANTNINTIDDFLDTEMAALTSAVDALPTSGELADESTIAAAVWNSEKADYTTADTFGDYLDDEISSVSGGGASASDIADAVWDELLAGHVVSGSAGERLGRIPNAAFPTNFAALGINASGHISRVTLADTITTYTGNTVQTGDSFARIGATGSGLTSLVDTVEFDDAIDGLPSLAELNARTLTAGNYATAGQASDIETAVNNVPSAVETVTALLNTVTSDTGAGEVGRVLHYQGLSFSSPGVFSEASLDNAPAGGGGGSMAWDDLVADHNGTPGTYGKLFYDILVDTGTDIPDQLDGLETLLNSSAIAATYVDEGHIWRFENASNTTAVNTVYENQPFDGLVGMRFTKAMPSGTSIDSVTAVTVATRAGDDATSDVTIGDSTITPDHTTVHTVIASAEPGEYVLTFTIVTVDSQTITRKGRLTIR